MSQKAGRICRAACLLFAIAASLVLTPELADAASAETRRVVDDKEALDELQRDAFNYMWEGACPHSGMAYEATFDWEERPVAVGGTGFGIAAIVVATDREWISREQAVARIMKIATFLKDRTPRAELHGAFPHWLEGSTGNIRRFGNRDDGADIVETSLLMQGLLIARAYFNGPGIEEELRGVITELWEGVDWNWFTNGEESGLYWHWSIEHGFYHGLKILGYNECLVTYIMAMSSPTFPISRDAYAYWSSGVDYLPRDAYGYKIEAAPNGGGPLFTAQYSFVGLDPRRLSDAQVTNGYFVRSVTQTLSNRGYCIYDAPPENRYSPVFWGLTASQTKAGYTAAEPARDGGTVAPTAAISSMPFTPHYSLQVLENLRGPLRERIWGNYGPMDAISLRDDWVSEMYLAIDQLPMVCMVENYRSGLLWKLLMSDPDIRAGLAKAGMAPPVFATGFPEAIVTMVKDDGEYVADAYEIRRHPDTGVYSVPYWCEEAGEAAFTLSNAEGGILFESRVDASKGSNVLTFSDLEPHNGEKLELVMRFGGTEYILPIRLH